MRRGLIRPGPAYLGVDALPNGAIIGQNGAASHVLYTLGSSMKGVCGRCWPFPRSESRQSGLRGCSSTATDRGAMLLRLMLINERTL